MHKTAPEKEMAKEAYLVNYQKLVLYAPIF